MATFTGTAADDNFIATADADQFRFGENEGDDLILDLDLDRDTLVYTDRSVDGFDDLDIASLSNGDAILESNDQATVLRGITIDQLRDGNFVFATPGPRGDLREDAYGNGPPDSDITAADVERREAQTRGDAPEAARGTADAEGGGTSSGGAGLGAILGTALPDVLVGTQSADRRLGGRGDDTLYGGQGNDLVHGDLGDDNQSGNLGRDTLLGGQGDDVLFGNQDGDRLSGGIGADTLFGGLGDDALSGDLGDDRLSGDWGTDTYVFGRNSGRDLALGFDQGEGDRLDLEGQTYEVATSEAGDALLRLSGGGSVELAGVGVKDIGDGLFV